MTDETPENEPDDERRLTEGGWEIALSMDAVNLIREVNERTDALENAVTRRAIQLCLPAVPNKGKPELRKRPAYADTEKVWVITCGY